MSMEQATIVEILWRQMAQIFDNDIAPYMEFKK